MSIENGLWHHSKETISSAALTLASRAVIFASRESTNRRKTKEQRKDVLREREIEKGYDTGDFGYIPSSHRI